MKGNSSLLLWIIGIVALAVGIGIGHYALKKTTKTA